MPHPPIRHKEHPPCLCDRDTLSLHRSKNRQGEEYKGTFAHTTTRLCPVQKSSSLLTSFTETFSSTQLAHANLILDHIVPRLILSALSTVILENWSQRSFQFTPEPLVRVDGLDFDARFLAEGYHYQILDMFSRRRHASPLPTDHIPR